MYYVPQDGGSFTVFQIAWDVDVEGREAEAVAIASTLLPATDEAIQLSSIRLNQVVEAGGITLRLPDGMVFDEASAVGAPTYYSADGSFTVGIVPMLVEELSAIGGNGALDLIAEGVAAGLEGAVEASAELVNNETTVRVYIFSFVKEETQYVGMLGMVPLADDTVTGVLSLTLSADIEDGEAAAETLGAIFSTIEAI